MEKKCRKLNISRIKIRIVPMEAFSEIKMAAVGHIEIFEIKKS